MDICPSVPDPVQLDSDLGYSSDFEGDLGRVQVSEGWTHGSMNLCVGVCWSKQIEGFEDGTTSTLELPPVHLAAGSLSVLSVRVSGHPTAIVSVSVDGGGFVELDRVLPPPGGAVVRTVDLSHVAGSVVVRFGMSYMVDDSRPAAIDDVSISVNGGAAGVFDGGDACDNCPLLSNANQADADGDGRGDACLDNDDDGVMDLLDNCVDIVNPRQLNFDDDAQGDACDDSDNDDVVDADDVCPEVADPDQLDFDRDGLGDPCDDDRDGDAVDNAADNCPSDPNQDQRDSDIGYASGFEADGGGMVAEEGGWGRRAGFGTNGSFAWVADGGPAQPLVSPPIDLPADSGATLSLWLAQNSHPNGCWTFPDGLMIELSADDGPWQIPGLSPGPNTLGDRYCAITTSVTASLAPFAGRRIRLRFRSMAGGIDVRVDDLRVDLGAGPVGVEDGGDACDNCPLRSNANQADADGDGVGDVCQDSDGDGVRDLDDNCPEDENPDQTDSDIGFGSDFERGDGGLVSVEGRWFHGGGIVSSGNFGWHLNGRDDDGYTESSSLVTPAVDIPVGGTATLSGWVLASQFLLQAGQCREGTGVRVEVSTDGGASWAGVGVDPAFNHGDRYCGVDGVSFTSDLSAFAGERIQARFRSEGRRNESHVDDVFISINDGPTGVDDACDNCPFVSNEDQADGDGDGVGDACEEEAE